MREFIDKTATNKGTPINRANMMALQGFENKTTRVLENGDIVETYLGTGHTKTTSIVGAGDTIQETFVGEKTISKIIRQNSDGSITELVL